MWEVWGGWGELGVRLSAQNANFFSLKDRKAGTFFDRKRHLPLSVNALRVNQQALVKNRQQRWKIKGFDG